MITGSVGKGGTNHPRDVKIVQELINQTNPALRLPIDGSCGPKTLAAIQTFQSLFMKVPDGKVDPFGGTIKRLWPVRYANPTGLGVRGTDPYGSGYFGAPRGTRIHDGVDYVAVPGHPVKAAIAGRVVRISSPYGSGIDWQVIHGLEIQASDGTQCWMFYFRPSHGIVGKVVKAGEIVGIAKTLQKRYPKDAEHSTAITDHIHVRIHTRFGALVDPTNVVH